MGGGSSKAPEPKTFTPPPINNAPPANPVANFFGARGTGAEAHQNPFAAMGQIPQAQAQNPFQQQGQVTPDMIAALLRQIRGGQ